MRDRTICQITSDSSFPKQRLLIYSIWHQNGITRRKYIYIYIYRSLEIFFPMIHIFSFAFFLVRVHLSLYATIFFFLVFRVAICIYIATVIRPVFFFFSSKTSKIAYTLFLETWKVSMIREWNIKRANEGGD